MGNPHSELRGWSAACVTDGNKASKITRHACRASDCMGGSVWLDASVEDGRDSKQENMKKLAPWTTKVCTMAPDVIRARCRGCEQRTALEGRTSL